MTENQWREEVSKAYIAAIAAQCKYKLGTWSQDDGLLDVSISAERLHNIPNLQINVQLKASNNQSLVKKAAIRHPIERKHHEILRDPKVMIPHLFIVVLLDQNENNWVTVSPSSLQIKKCAYFVNLAGAEALEGKTDKGSVYIPKVNVFTPGALRTIMESHAKRIQGLLELEETTKLTLETAPLEEAR